MDEKVPGGQRAALADGESLHDESDDSCGGGRYPGPSAAAAAAAGRVSHRTASQSLPRFLDGGDGTRSPSSGARKVDSLPVKIIDESSSSFAGIGGKTRAKKIIRSLGSFVQKVARQLTSVTFHVSPAGSRFRELDSGPDAGDSDGSSSHSSGRVHVRLAASEPGEKPPGVVGIHNHGNTCFMNAVLQCLSNTEVVLGYFIMDQYKDDMRRSNKHTAKKFGTKGELTEQLAALLKSLWTSKYTPEISNEFKATVAKYGCQYRGSSQHDAQEFLIWLLDKVHEDLNVAMKKKYRANKSSYGRSDDEVAAEALANHARCNNSFIYDIFQALYRSSLTCPNCCHRSTTFDPFLSVSLPIPHKTIQPVNVVAVRENEMPRRFGFVFEQDWLVSELRQAVAKEIGVPVDTVILLEIESSGVHRTMNDIFVMNELSDNVVIYSMNTSVPAPTPVLQSNCESASTCDGAAASRDVASSHDVITVVVVKKLVNSSESKRFGAPFLLELSDQTTVAELRAKILASVGQLEREEDNLNLVNKDSFSLTFEDTILSEVLENPANPLMSERIKEALSQCSPGIGPRHIRLSAEFQTSSLPVSSVNETIEDDESVRQVRSSVNQSSLGTLDECFHVYTQEEQLGPDNAWLCPSCRKYQQGTVKALTLWSLPEILVIHLKRFRLDTVQRTKLNTLIVFPINGLDLRSHVQKATAASTSSTLSRSVKSGARAMWKSGRKTADPDEYLYDLYAVCNHYGDMQSGHYTAFCKNLCDKKWYSYNDNKATEMREADVTTRAAYLLFYQKRATNFPRSHDWLNTLKQIDYNVSRAVTSHSLDDLLDGDCESSVTGVSPDDDFRRAIPVYTTQSPPERITRRASARQAKSFGASNDANSSASLPRPATVSSQAEGQVDPEVAVAASNSSLQRVARPSCESVVVNMNGRASSEASVDNDSQSSSSSRSRETLVTSTARHVASHEDGRCKGVVATDLTVSSGVACGADSRAAPTKSNGTTSTSTTSTSL